MAGCRRDMQTEGIILKGIDGLYQVQTDTGDTVLCGARGVLRHRKIRPLSGDRVLLSLPSDGNAGNGGVAIVDILPRKNELKRPPIANLSLLGVVLAAAKPAPVLTVADKMLTVAERKQIVPVILITKADVAPLEAERLASIYRRAGFPVFLSGFGREQETADLLSFLLNRLSGGIAAFSGASGVGKSTLIVTLFPQLHLETGEMSRKTERGRHTTRCVTLFPLSELTGGQTNGFLADTPGFSMLDLWEQECVDRRELAGLFREFRPYLGLCRYTDCTHTREDGCAVLEAVECGDIPKSRHLSFLSMYEELKDKHVWDKKT